MCIMIHSGSRGLGHQVATDALTAMEKAMARDRIPTNDRQLACALIHSQEGKVRFTHAVTVSVPNVPQRVKRRGEHIHVARDLFFWCGLDKAGFSETQEGKEYISAFS